MISYEDFAKVDLRIGTIVAADAFPEARKPAYKLTIDFGELGIKRSSVQITKVYALEELVGKQVIAVVNFPHKQIGPFLSECLVCGFDRAPGEVVLAQPGEPVPNGSRMY
ncbi:tRNA-binding protein [Fimbriimonas ginsengisoli]|uniref:Protein secretion chaperonin CsaA n=1 Tax=Fimbriimonas ginsengisoli Gsoil 348 TaxID=661478 RepID=A0A068NQP6_FIMGI|nr:tRNA-binding protein [Fimbriimonas ginsengisoli]AIE83924.1 Protein secretion chaperonin CsaA [Fimbriimonas ginsengisoli Gsoil 348]